MPDTAAPAGLRYPWPDPPAPGAATEVAEGILWLRLPLPMALDHVNVYALAEPCGGWTLIDTGVSGDRARAEWAALLEGPLGGQPVRRVVVTHHHPDHVGLAGWFVAEHGAELIATRTAWLMARMLTLDVQDRPDPATLAFWRRAGMDPAILAERLTTRPFNFADVVAPLPLGYTRIAEGDPITLGGRHWRVRIGNGHAPEQATFWAEDAPIVLGADQLLPSISPNIGVYATEPEADPLADWLESCTRLGAFAEDGHLVLPGHKLPFTGLPFRLTQLIENHHGALERLHAHLAVPHTAGGCFAPLFKRRIGAGEYGLALVEAVAHLNHLHRQGRATRAPGDGGAWLWRAT